MSRPESYMIETDLMRDAVYAGIWTRLCVEIRGHHADGNGINEYIERFSVGRGDPAEILAYLDEDIDFLTEARRQLRALRETPLGSTVELDDIERFMPISWIDDDPSRPGRWIYTDSETEEAELLVPEAVKRVRRPGSDGR